MFIGHYGVSLAAKKYESRISLGILFLAVQFLDILFAILVLLNIEHMRIVPGFTKFNPYDLYYMPYSHSLLGALLWSVLVALIYWWVVRPWDSGSKGAAIIGFAVFSHFLLDLPMHVHDMPLLMSESSTKFGLGLWNHRNLSLLAEAVCFFGGAFLYLRSTQAVSKFAFSYSIPASAGKFARLRLPGAGQLFSSRFTGRVRRQSTRDQEPKPLNLRC